MSMASRKELLHEMARVREFELRTADLYRDTEIPGFVHVSVGQEAVPVGVASALRRDDVITSNHRGHGHVLAKGADMRAMFAELMAKETGSCRGRGGSMHIADLSVGVFGANGIVGAGLPIAVGAATAVTQRGGDQVVAAFFGDGAVGQGAFHEALNLAAVRRLPVVFVCENNHFAEFSGPHNLPMVPLSQRAEGYGVRYLHADGNDAEAVAEQARTAVELARTGQGPVFLEAETYRLRGHYEGDQQKYRTGEELDDWLARDPLEMLAERLRDEGVDQDEITALYAAVRHEVDEAVAFARESSLPSDDTLRWYVSAPAHQVDEVEEVEEVASGEEIRTSRAIGAALHDILTDDPLAFLAGIDMVAGNVFGLTRGLADAFPGRLIDTPISETALMGLGVGSAMSGMHPIVELMYVDFLGVCFDQLLNQAAKMRFMTGGQTEMPLTVRTQFGAGRASGSQHSQSLEAIFAHVPGLRVVMPSTPADTYGLLRSAVDDPNPVIVIENRLLYETKGPAPMPGHRVPLGKAKVVRPGSDLTIVSWSRMVHTCLRVAETWADRGVQCEVIDLRSISPLDHDTVMTSVAKTSRLLIAHEAVQDFGVGAEIAARVAEEGFTLLDAPVSRVGAPSMPAPYAPNLERLWLPGEDDLDRRIAELVAF